MGMHKLVSEYAKLLRLPGLGGLSIAPVFGAISVGVLSLPELSLIFLMGVFSAIYGFVLNDYIDIEVDKLSKELSDRPLVKGTISKNTALLLCLICFIGTFLVIFLFFSHYTYMWFGIVFVLLAAVTGSVYNIYGKRFIGSDFLVALSEGFLVLFGAFIVLNNLSDLTIFSWIIFILTFNQLLFMNAVEGGLKDADHDYLKDVKNIALWSGVKVGSDKSFTIPFSFKAFGFVIRIFSAFLVFIPVLFYHDYYQYEFWEIGLLVLFVIGVLYLSYKLLNLKRFDRKVMRKLITGETFLRYSLVPLMLLAALDTLVVVFLIVFPFVWYIILTPLTGRKAFQPGI